ncbi:MAG: hypothetical protein EA361_15480 [Bacteroidetes bacterium]|nr:MAG: hypothetical protein EA361_15480 [Bacteroidota bacterium]
MLLGIVQTDQSLLYYNKGYARISDTDPYLSHIMADTESSPKKIQNYFSGFGKWKHSPKGENRY